MTNKCRNFGSKGSGMDRLFLGYEYGKIMDYVRNRLSSEFGWIPSSSKVSKAKLTAVLFYILDLQTIEGIDADYSELYNMFNDLRANDLDEIRSKTEKIAAMKLEKQIAEKNTFFLDIEKMASGPFSGLIDGILDARITEIKELAPRCTLHSLLSTYYGFLFLTTTEDPLTVAGIENTKELGTAFVQMFEEYDVSLESTTHSISQTNFDSMFSNCSKKLRDILISWVKTVSYSNDRKVVSSVRRMTDRGYYIDRRMRGMLLAAWKRSDNSLFQVELAKYIAKVGNASDASLLIELGNSLRRTRDKVALLEAMGSFPGSNSLKYLIKNLYQKDTDLRITSIRSLILRNYNELKHALMPWFSGTDVGALDALLFFRECFTISCGFRSSDLKEFYSIFDDSILSLAESCSEEFSLTPNILKKILKDMMGKSMEKSGTDINHDERVISLTTRYLNQVYNLRARSEMIDLLKIMKSYSALRRNEKIQKIIISSMTEDNSLEVAKTIASSSPYASTKHIRAALASLMKDSTTANSLLPLLNKAYMKYDEIKSLLDV